jgi:putative intracellular protease/amidase
MNQVRQAHALFQKIWIVESLPDGDLKTGRRLMEGPLVQAPVLQPDLEIEFRTPNSRDDFLAVLDAIEGECVTLGRLPMLHLDCHGCEDGLQMASGELVQWNEIRGAFIKINEASRFNFIVILAACHGANVLAMATQLDRAPFWAAIAPEEEVTAGHVDQAFGAFYSELLRSLSGDAAIAALNHQDQGRVYHFISAEGFFKRAFRNYYNDFCRGEGREVRIAKLLEQVMANANVAQNLGEARARSMIEAHIDNTRADFEKWRRRYFMVEQFPEIEQRVHITYEDVVQ